MAVTIIISAIVGLVVWAIAMYVYDPKRRGLTQAEPKKEVVIDEAAMNVQAVKTTAKIQGWIALVGLVLLVFVVVKMFGYLDASDRRMDAIMEHGGYNKSK